MSRNELLELARTQTTVDLVTAGRAWSIGRTKVHELARAQQLPFPALRLGAQYRVPVEPLLRSLGINADAEPTHAPAPLRAVGD